MITGCHHPSAIMKSVNLLKQWQQLQMWLYRSNHHPLKNWIDYFEPSKLSLNDPDIMPEATQQMDCHFFPPTYRQEFCIFPKSPYGCSQKANSDHHNSLESPRTSYPRQKAIYHQICMSVMYVMYIKHIYSVLITLVTWTLLQNKILYWTSCWVWRMGP